MEHPHMVFTFRLHQSNSPLKVPVTQKWSSNGSTQSIECGAEVDVGPKIVPCTARLQEEGQPQPPAAAHRSGCCLPGNDKLRQPTA